MTTLTKSRSKGAKAATKAVRSKTKATKRRVARKGAVKLAKEAVPPKRKIAAFGVGAGALAAGLAVLRGRKSKAKNAGPSYSPPSGPPAAGS